MCFSGSVDAGLRGEVAGAGSEVRAERTRHVALRERDRGVRGGRGRALGGGGRLVRGHRRRVPPPEPRHARGRGEGGGAAAARARAARRRRALSACAHG